MENTTTASSERKQAAALAVETGADSTPFPAAAMATPVLLPSTRSLRMFLGVLKHNPVGVIRDVGVLLMLFVSSTEAAAAAGAAATPSAPLPGDGCNRGRTDSRGFQPRTNQSRESAHQKRRSEEAAAVLALALATEKRRVEWLAAGGGVTASGLAKRNKLRFQHQLRQPAKMEDRLQTWAATRGCEVSALQKILALSAGGAVGAGSAGARLVRDRASRIPMKQVGKVRSKYLVHQTKYGNMFFGSVKVVIFVSCAFPFSSTGSSYSHPETIGLRAHLSAASPSASDQQQV